MSLSAADPAAEYRNGLRKPSAGCPTDKSWSLSREITLANIGLAQLVPETPPISPSTTGKVCGSIQYAAGKVSDAGMCWISGNAGLMVLHAHLVLPNVSHAALIHLSIDMALDHGQLP